MKVKRLYYFAEKENGMSRELTEEEYNAKIEEYEGLSWDKDEYSRSFINSKDYTQYENCTRFYLNDSYITFGYGQREFH